MKKLFILSAIMLVIISASCEQAQQKSAEVKGYSKLISIGAEDQLDFDTIMLGTVGEGEIITGSFGLRNATPEQLVIANIITGCGCTTTNYDKKPMKAGEERQIDFTFDTKGKHGFQFQGIDIVTTDHKKGRIFIEAEVTPTKR